jgi:hypothetical protein
MEQANDNDRWLSIQRVLNFYNDEFAKSLAVAISASEKVPDEINIQVRNAFTHVARIINAQTVEAINKESAAGIAHLERASRDCIKVAVVFDREKLEALIANLHFIEGKISVDYNTRYNHIKDLRRNYYLHETKGDPEHRKALEMLWREIVSLSNDIVSQNSLAWTKSTQFQRFFRRHSTLFVLFSATLGGLILRPFAEQLWTYIKNFF